MKKLTRKYFVSIYSDMAKVRRNDPIDFEIRFNEWKRLRQKHI
jgi:hypothetical protein